MHIAVPIHDPYVPSSINIFHAEAIMGAWTSAYVARNRDHADRLIAASVALARQPFVDPPHLSDPPEWMMEPETEYYLEFEPCPDIHGWGPVEEKEPAADEDDEIEIADEDEASAVLRSVEDEI